MKKHYWVLTPRTRLIFIFMVSVGLALIIGSYEPLNNIGMGYILAGLTIFIGWKNEYHESQSLEL